MHDHYDSEENGFFREGIDNIEDSTKRIPQEQSWTKERFLKSISGVRAFARTFHSDLCNKSCVVFSFNNILRTRFHLDFQMACWDWLVNVEVRS